MKEGYSNKYLKEKSDRGYVIDLYKHKLTKIISTSKSSKFNVISLISDGVIDKITLNNENQGKFNQKCFLIFSKSDKGYHVKFCYREQTRKYILCGLQTSEFVIDEFELDNDKIIELRRNAKNNSSFSIGDIRFNVFYLVNLLNSFENINTN